MASMHCIRSSVLTLGKAAKRLWPAFALCCAFSPTLGRAQISEAGPARILTEYALTSAQDYSNPDPGAWCLFGSNDAGRSWVLLDARTNQTFNARSERKAYAVSNRVSYNTYRLQLDKAGEVAIAELELMGPAVGVTNELELHTRITSSSEQSLIGPAILAFDGDPTTKWVDFGSDETSATWLQCQYVLANEITLTNIGQFLLAGRRNAARNPLLDKAPQILSNLTAQASKPLQTLVGYALRSANDFPCRDPRDWRLLGSNDGGRTWNTLDVRTNQIFSLRYQRRAFFLSKPAAYALYRFQIDSIRTPGADGADSVQIAQIEPLSPDGQKSERLSLVVSAQGQNPPMETAVKAFDGVARTKWLDFGEIGASKSKASNIARSSWIQWQYLGGVDLPVIDLHLLQTIKSRPSDVVKLDLEAVVVSWDPTAKVLGLLDDTGFQCFAVDSLKHLRPGQRVRLTGRPRFTDELPTVVGSAIEVVGSLPVASDIRGGLAMDLPKGFSWGAAEGRVSAVSKGPGFLEIRLGLGNGAGYVIARVLDKSGAATLFPADSRLRAEGVVQAVLNEDGNRTSAVLWVPDLDNLNIASVSEQDWQAWPERPVASLVKNNSAATPGGPVRLQGTVIAQDVTGISAVSGRHNFTIRTKSFVAVPPRAHIEAIGFLGMNGIVPAVQRAQIRTIAEPEVDRKDRGDKGLESQTLTHVQQVQDSLQREPGRPRQVRVRGVVTYIDPGLTSFYLQEGQHAILVNGLLRAGLGPFLQQEGLYLEIYGETSTNQVAIETTRLATVLGRSQMPEAPLRSWDYLVTGNDFGQWIAIDGVVSELDEHRLVLTVRGGKLPVQINDASPRDAGRLLGSLVRVCGVCAPISNGRNAVLGIRLLVPSMNQVQLLRESPNDLYALPLRPIGELLRFGSLNGLQGGRLVKTAGVVTYHQPGLMFLQNEDSGLSVLLREEAPVESGDRVEVVGFAEPDGFSPRLVQAVARVVGRAPLPATPTIDLLDADLGSHDAKRAQIDAIVSATSIKENLQVLELRDERSERSFSAFFPTNQGILPAVPAGSRVRVQGVLKAGASPLQDAGEIIGPIQLFGSSPRDLTILTRPSWWTMRRTVWFLAGLAGVLSVSLFWVWTLRQQVRRRTQDLRAEIDQRARAEEALQASRAQLQLQLDRMPIACIAWSPDFRVTSWNPAAEKIFGFAAAEAMGRHPFGLIVEEDTNREIEQLWSRLVQGEMCAHSVNRNRAKDGRLLVCDWTNTPLHSKTGAFLGVLSMVQDITERKAAETQLAYERDLLKTLLDHSPDVIYFKDLQSRFVRFSKSFADLFRVGDPQVLQGKTDFDFFTEEHARQAFEDEQQIIRSGAPIIRKTEKETHPGGRVTWALTNKLPWRDEGGNIIGTFGLSQSITAIKEAEAKLEQAHQQLLEVSRRAGMSEIATSVLHNVGNALNSVNVSASVMEEQLRKSRSSDLSRLVRLLREQQARLAEFLTSDPRGRTVTEFLDQLSQKLAREQAALFEELASLRHSVDHINDIVAMQQNYAKVSGVTEIVEMAELVEDTLRMNASSLARHDIQIVRDLATTGPVTVDKHKVIQILTNLVRNATDACEESGRGDKRVEVRIKKESGIVRISVSDNGVGILPQHMTRIFNHGFTTKPGGHGFGLHGGALAAKELGGSLTVYSDGPGQGAIFTLELPTNPPKS